MLIAQPVSCGSIFGALGGPWSGHRVVLQVAVVEGSDVGQMN